MLELDNTNEENSSTDEQISLSFFSNRDEFFKWLSVGNAIKYSPHACVAFIENASDYALYKKIINYSLWTITQESVFRLIYNKLLKNRLFRITKKSIYKGCIIAGQLYLKFLKEKTYTYKTAAIKDSAEKGIEKGKDELINTINPVDVIEWLVTQPNAHGTLYLENVVRSYISALRSAPSKLDLAINKRDVFSCLTVAELDVLWDVFREAPNYKEVNSATSGSLSAGLAVYRRYLEHLSVVEKNKNSGNLGLISQPSINSEVNEPFTPAEIDDEYLFGLKEEFGEYIRQRYPEWSNSTINMHKSDAYFLKNNNVGISLAAALANEGALLVARDKIRDYLRDVNKVGNPENGANGYLRTLKIFKGFIFGRNDSILALTKEKLDFAVVERLSFIISTRFANGFRLKSPIEMARLRSFVAEDLGEELLLPDEELKAYIASCGTTFDGKIYVVSTESKEHIKKLANEYFADGARAIFFAEFYAKNESWLFGASIVSENMLIGILRSLFPKLSFTQTYFGNTDDSVFTVLESEILRVWGEDILLSYDQIAARLQYIPLERIKYALGQNGDFIWNSAETFSHISRIEITDKEREKIRVAALRECNARGYVSITELPFCDIEERNYELTVTAVQNAVYRICLWDKFDKKGKIITRKGDVFDALIIMKEYCRTVDKCLLQDLLNYEKELTGEVHRWVPMEAGNTVLVRIDKENYVSDKYVHFDVDLVDEAIESVVKGDYLPLKSFITFGAFPDCGQTWNLFLLESYCRRFSRKFCFDTSSVNSRNAGAVIRKSCAKKYTEIMADAVAKANVPLNDTAIGRFLCDSGYTGRSTTSKAIEIIDKVKALRERRD